jgi:hypothetical protein
MADFIGVGYCVGFVFGELLDFVLIHMYLPLLQSVRSDKNNVTF